MAPVSCTLIIQVKRTDGEFMNVPYRSDAVLVNVGALMQNWTSDVYKATVRRGYIIIMCMVYSTCLKLFNYC